LPSAQLHSSLLNGEVPPSSSGAFGITAVPGFRRRPRAKARGRSSCRWNTGDRERGRPGRPPPTPIEEEEFFNHYKKKKQWPRGHTPKIFPRPPPPGAAGACPRDSRWREANPAPHPNVSRRLEHTATSQEQSHPPSAAASSFPVDLVEASTKLKEGPARTEVSWLPVRPLDKPRGVSVGFHQGGS
jgi:hypothetical protein